MLARVFGNWKSQVKFIHKPQVPQVSYGGYHGYYSVILVIRIRNIIGMLNIGHTLKKYIKLIK